MLLPLLAAWLGAGEQARAQNGLLREVYTGLPAGTLNALTNHFSFPDSPASVGVITDFEAPVNVGDFYGQRVRGYLVPPQTGAYTFWIASDDGSILFLSTDQNPANRAPIARVDSWTGFREWDQEPNQRSAPIQLEQGKRYYIEALMAEGTGGDHLSVRWQLPDGTMDEPISSRYLLVELIPPQIARQPAPVRVMENEDATFTVEVANLGPVEYQWQRNGVNIPGATNAVYTRLTVPLSEDGSRYRVVLRNQFGAVTSTEATLRVDPDLSPPSLELVLTAGENDLVRAVFSKPVELSSATEAGHYRIDPGITVLEAVLDSDLKTVVLRTSAMEFGRTYRLTVNGIRDRTANGNVIDAGSWREFTHGFAPLDVGRVRGRSEPLGPSTRRTGLVISEIMYHPPAREDGRVAEFIEIHNSQSIIKNIGGFRLGGAVEYTFPPGTFISAGGFLVVAPVPADVQAVYGLPRVLGGFDRLPKEGGTIQLINHLGAVLLEARYDVNPRWPTAADEAGHSLVLARPSYGERESRAWAASQFYGGSPGRAEVPSPDPFRTVLINEFLAHTDEPQADYIELYNYGGQPVDISGCYLSDNPRRAKFRIPEGTILEPLGFIVFDQDELGFALSSRGERIFLVNPDQTRVIDAIRFEAQANGVSMGRFPDGAPDFVSLAEPTPGWANSPPFREEIIINEIMYNPISRNDDDEYIELYNRGGAPVDVSGWRIVDGIRFTFPPGTVIEPAGYLVVGRNASRLMANYPQLNESNTVGDYSGRLSNSGERIALVRPEATLTWTEENVAVTNTLLILVNEVTYRDGGRWGQWSDGGGSSLELIDPESDNRLAANWADSDETKKAGWTTIEFTGILDHGHANFPAVNLHVMLLEAGECLIDNVEVLDGAGRNLVANPTFESGLNHWVLDANHSGSALETTEGFAGSRSLLVRTTHRGDTGPNRIRTRLQSALPAGSQATLRARVRWLRGHPEILLRLHGNYLEASGRMDLPANLGTPGLPNSARVANAGPAIFDVTHSPVLPAANQQVEVLARVSDPDQIASVRLRYRLDPSTNFVSAPMFYRGAGYYSATVPGQPAGQMVAFHVQATDRLGGAAQFPEQAPVREGLVLFGDSQAPGNFGTYRIWITQETIDRWSSRHRGTNDRSLDSTFVYGNTRVVYNAGVDYSGSPFHWGNFNSPIGNNCNYVAVMPKDDLVLGEDDFVLNMPANLGSDNTAIREQIFFWIAREMGTPYSYRRFHYLFVNGIRRGTVYEDAQQPNREFLRQWFPEDWDGQLYKIEDWFEFNDVASSFNNVNATLENFTTSGGEKKLARYRWNWRKRSLRGDSANDYEKIFELVDAVNTPGTAYTRAVESLVDVEQWMRIMAARHIVGDWDSYGYRRGKNMYAYKPENGKWQLLHWDAAFNFGMGHGATQNLFDALAEPVIERMLSHPPFRRAYWRALYDAAHGPLQASRINPIIDAHYQGLIGNGVPVVSPEAIKQWTSQRLAYIMTQLNTVATAFAITSNGGNDFSTNRNQVTLTGTAPVQVKTIKVNGVAYPVTWTSERNWSLRYALSGPANSLVVEGFDRHGQLVAGARADVAIEFTGGLELPEQRLVINELMYHPAVPGAEFIEVHNTSSLFAFDLSNYRLRGVGFTFAEGTIIQPGGFVVVANDAAVFAAVYGGSGSVAGEFPGRLRPGGERIRLVRTDPVTAEEILVSSVTYSSELPWPAAANGMGASLQLIDPSRDASRVGNWAAVAGVATPGRANSVRAALPAFPRVWINEIQPENVSGITDGAGGRNPWLELYNSGTAGVDLTGYYLTESYASLTRWAFPDGARIEPGEFRVVWLDGEPGETTGVEWRANFRIAPGSGQAALVRMQNNQPAVIDYLNYSELASDRSFGLFPDGEKGEEHYFFTPTPGAANTLAAPALQVFVNEWMASNTGTAANPVDGRFDDWFELYNPGSSPVDLSGYTLSDKLDNPGRFVIPQGVSIPPNGFLLVWADDNPDYNDLEESPDLHVNFKLARAGEAIGLYAPDGSPVDLVVFGEQTSDVSQGRFPDGGAEPFHFMPFPTPGSSNRTDEAGPQFQQITASGGGVTLTWESTPGQVYLIQYKDQIGQAVWTVLGEFEATGPVSTVVDDIGVNAQRFYRLTTP